MKNLIKDVIGFSELCAKPQNWITKDLFRNTCVDLQLTGFRAKNGVKLSANGSTSFWQFLPNCTKFPPWKKKRSANSLKSTFLLSGRGWEGWYKLYPFQIKTSGGSRIFPRGGREPSRGGVNTPNFPENCMKSKEFGRPGGGVRPSRPPLDPPMKTVQNCRFFC